MKHVVILISGTGSNMAAIVRAAEAQRWGERLGARVAAVISNRPNAGGLEFARKAGIATAVVDHQAFDGRAAFDAALRAEIDRHAPSLVVLAGFMRILSADFVRHYAARLMNIHPSLLPLYPGLHTHQRALEAGDTAHGATVHFVSEELDGGPAIVQSRVPVHAADTAETLAARVLLQEHRIYPHAVRLFAEGRLQLRNGRALLDGDALPATGLLFPG